MGIDLGAGWPVFGDRAASRIQFAYVSLEDRGKPDIAVRIRYQPVRTGIRRFERIFLELARPWIKPSQLVCQLSGVPERSIGRDGRIMRAGTRCWHFPFLDGHLRNRQG